MAEYIECRECNAPSCTGCNTYILSQMLHRGKFNCLMDDHHTIRSIADVAPKVHGRWVINRKSEDAYAHHMCSKCKTDAPFHYTSVADYDEGMDGEWHYLRQVYDGIVEYMGNYCPNCGAKMDAEA